MSDTTAVESRPATRSGSALPPRALIRDPRPHEDLHVLAWFVPQQREAAAHRLAERDPVADQRRGLHGTPAQQAQRDAEVLIPDV